MATTSKRRWLIWTVLLMASTYLALFGDKTPDAPATSSMTNSQVNATSAHAPVLKRDLGTTAPLTGRAPAVRANVGSDPEQRHPLIALLPRNTLFPARARGKPVVDIFAARSWVQASPAAVSGESAPAAPALPYVYVGKKLEDGAWEVYLSRGDIGLVARLGATLEGTYEVQRIAPPVLTVKYKPLGQIQTLSIGEFSE